MCQEYSRKKEKKKGKLKPYNSDETIRVNRDGYHSSTENNSKRKLTCLSLYKLLHEVSRSIFYKEYGSRNDSENLCKRNYC